MKDKIATIFTAIIMVPLVVLAFAIASILALLPTIGAIALWQCLVGMF